MWFLTDTSFHHCTASIWMPVFLWLRCNRNPICPVCFDHGCVRVDRAVGWVAHTFAPGDGRRLCSDGRLSGFWFHRRHRAWSVVFCSFFPCDAAGRVRPTGHLRTATLRKTAASAEEWRCQRDRPTRAPRDSDGIPCLRTQGRTAGTPNAEFPCAPSPRTHEFREIERSLSNPCDGRTCNSKFETGCNLSHDHLHATESEHDRPFCTTRSRVEKGCLQAAETLQKPGEATHAHLSATHWRTALRV